MSIWDRFLGKIKCNECSKWVIPENGYCPTCGCDIQNFVVGVNIDSICITGSTIEDTAYNNQLIHFYKKYKNLQ